MTGSLELRADTRKSITYLLRRPLPRLGSGVRIPSPAPMYRNAKAAGNRGFSYLRSLAISEATFSGEEISMSLTLEEANRIIRGALAKAQELNIKISAAVCDSGGRLIALQRMDNAIWASAYGSQGKAVASAAFGRPSGEMAERADQPTPRGIAAASGGHMIMGQGAVPIIRNGIVEGACGVGGGTSQQDEDCARAGIAQL
ncbi:MAG: heme-binding protein [Alphaproteobacteria bacterium]|nr:MAG: heme-binding protein [Alphaproteobacteria bacterium]